ncbi:MAG: tetratricopeptide (TPR) repeat protein [Planctomycetota bacterium]|jgi:tetratricopeptide (TPR) repeat protein
MAFPSLKPRALLVTLLGLGIGAWFLGSCSGKPSAPRASDLLLLYTGNVHGYIEPCGCSAGQIGGIDRLAGYIHEERKARPGTSLHIDSGDLFAEGIITDDNTVQQLRVKAESFLDAWGEIGCDAIGVGEAEISLGIAQLAELSEQSGVPFLASNIVDPDGVHPLTTHLIFERAGMKIGLFSLIASKLEEAKVNKDKETPLGTHKVDELLGAQGYRIQPWQARAEELIAELRPQVDMLFCVSHLGFKRNEILATKHPELDLIFGGHFYNSEGPTAVIGDTPVLTSMVKGSRVGRMEWWLEDKDDYLAASNQGVPGELVDYSERIVMETQRDASRQAYQDLAGLEQKYGTEKWNNKRRTEGSLYYSAASRLLEMGEAPAGNRFSHAQIPMHTAIPRSELALAAVDDYHRATDIYWAAQRPGALPRIDSKGVFAGAEACDRCHSEQYEFWLGTRHSRAFATLEATDQESDAECIGCHTIGYQMEGGFDRPSRAQGFENVQCAACHGGGLSHMAGGMSPMLPGLISSGYTGCARCHRDEHDPLFEQDGFAKLPLVACPPIGSAGPISAGLKKSYSDAAKAFASKATPNWDKVSLAYAGAGENQKAFIAAQKWLNEDSRSIEAILNYGERALTVGQIAKASGAFRRVTKATVASPRAWIGLSISLFDSDPAGSLTAALEAYSLDPNQAIHARFVAMGMMATGQAEKAKEHMQKHIAFQPSHGPMLMDLLNQL